MTVEGAGKAVAVVSGAIVVPAAAEMGHAFWVVALPLIATWVALVGINVIDDRPFTVILREAVGSLLIGGVLGITALQFIRILELRDEYGVLLTVFLGLCGVTLVRILKRGDFEKLLSIARVLVDLFDLALGKIGLQRKRDND